MVDPRRIAQPPADKAGASGRYGFREALDYTARQLPEAVVPSSVAMAHHKAGWLRWATFCTVG